MFKITNYRNACDCIYDSLQGLDSFTDAQSPHSARTISKMSALLSKIAFRKILHDEPVVLEELANKSYAHENGFFKLTLIDSPKARFRVRLHFWSAEKVTPISIENIHNHRFNYYSYLLSGSLQNKIWRAGNNGMELMHFRYYPRLQKESYILEHHGDTRLETLSEMQYYQGDLYCMKAEDLHTASVLAGTNAVTLFIEERSNLRNYADVFSTEYSPKNLSRSSPSLTSAKYLELLAAIDVACTDLSSLPNRWQI